MTPSGRSRSWNVRGCIERRMSTAKIGHLQFLEVRSCHHGHIVVTLQPSVGDGSQNPRARGPSDGG
jgi:hypothetical protein